ncbi:MAG: HEAT repeat domain-containing protein, partial [Candidatus Heimdallarchaeota archaeon]
SAQAIHSLGEFGEKAGFISGILSDLFLKNTNDWIRYNIIVTLGKIKQIPEEKIEEIGKLLLSESNDEIRFEIAKSLEKIGNTAQITEPELIQALGIETKEIIQMQLIKTIGELQIQNMEAINLLRKLLEKSDNVFIRIFSALSLGRIGEENSIETLLKVKNEENDVEISRAIEWALREIKRRKLLAFLLRMNPEKTLPITDIAKNANIGHGETIELMTKILQDARKIGFYSSQKELFRKYEGIDEFIHLMMRSKTKYPKYHTCFDCKYPIKIEENICPSCKGEIPKCPICKLPISEKDYIGICEKCNVKGHLTHFREWVEVKGTCPRCLQPTKVKVITHKRFITE